MISDNDMIYNWSNSLRKTDDGATVTAIRMAEKLKNDGYARGEACDILVADDYDMKLVDNVLGRVYASTDEEVVEEPSEVSYVVPTAYADIKPFIEMSLMASSARDFMTKLAHSEYPIIKSLSGNGFESFVRLAEQAKENRYSLEALHNDLEPFMETAMFESVKIAETNKSRTVVAIDNSDETDVCVSYSVAKSNDVSLKTATCNCDKYIKGNYAEFGLACEHIVSAAEMVSPNQKLPRNFAG